MILDGKRILITGVLTRESIAFAIAKQAQEYGAEIILTSFGRQRRLTERTAKRLGNPEILDLDVTNDEDFHRLADELMERWGSLDGVVHSIAHAPPSAMGGRFMDSPKDAVMYALEVSAVSLKTLGHALTPLFEANGGGSIVSMGFNSYHAWPGYDWMGVAKTALEAINRYVAFNLGQIGVRANIVSAGILQTEAARAIPGFHFGAKLWNQQAPIGWEAGDPGPVADAACFLLSDASRGITGEILNVDGGRHAVGGAMAVGGDGELVIVGAGAPQQLIATSNAGS